MDLDPVFSTTSYTATPVNFPISLNGTRIRVYYLTSIFFASYRPDTLRQLRVRYRLSYPYTWYVYNYDQAVIVDIDHLIRAYEQIHGQQSSSSSSYNYYEYNSDEEVAIQVLQESFQQASDELVAAVSGLTKKEISENLKISEYYCEEEEEESEVCVICQAEYEKNEKVGAIQCGHRFHPECIEEWLVCKNVCPLCKHQALKV